MSGTPTPADTTPSARELRAVNEAAAWYARLSSEAATPNDRQAWSHWLASDAAHRAAWGKVEQVCRQMGRLPGSIARPTLAPAKAARRTVLRNIGLGAGAGAASWLGWRTLPWEGWTADYRSAVGERRDIRLADGSSMLMDTDTSVDVSFDAQARILDLRSGAILVSTHPDPAATPRPFLVRTRQGTATALGTRYTVRTEDGWTRVAVLEKSVRIAPAQGQGAVVLHAGQQARFSRDTIEAPNQTTSPPRHGLAATSSCWTCRWANWRPSWADTYAAAWGATPTLPNCWCLALSRWTTPIRPWPR